MGRSCRHDDRIQRILPCNLHELRIQPLKLSVLAPAQAGQHLEIELFPSWLVSAWGFGSEPVAQVAAGQDGYSALKPPCG